MGIFDAVTNAIGGLTGGLGDAVNQVVEAVGGDQLTQVIDSATDKIDEATGGASSVITEQVDGIAGGAVGNLAGN